MFNPKEIIFLVVSGVMAILFSKLRFSFIDPIDTLKFYNRVMANITRSKTTATVPNKTNLVKLFQVFL
jgi:hypothetical protein